MTLLPRQAIGLGAPQTIIEPLSCHAMSTFLYPVPGISFPVASMPTTSCQFCFFFRNIFMPIQLFKKSFPLPKNSSFFFFFSLPGHQKCELRQELDFSFLLKRAFRGANSSFSFFFVADPPEILQSFALSLMEKKRLFGPLFSFLVSDENMPS